jgi:subtilase family protein/fibronectin type III domain protein/peptidase inhibitor I9/PA domain-containing protein
MGPKSFGALIALVAIVAVVVAVPASGGSDEGASATYIVQLVQAPVAGYEGGVAGYAATRPGKGKKLDASSKDAERYAGYLQSKHDSALDRVGGATKIYDYTAVFNGFAADLTEAQAAKLEASKGILSVEKAENVEVDTSSTPAFLGLSSKGGLWDQLGGTGKGGLGSGAGEDVVIGDVDGGYWPENPAFSDRKVDGSNGNLYPHKVTGFSGACQAGEDFAAGTCNGKVIAARYFNAGIGVGRIPDYEYLSPRDYGGHGSHTASTMVGNFGVQATGDAASFGKLSGIAPRARLAVYKACWVLPGAPSGSCNSADTTAAIDQAVEDGVDAINYSISGSKTSFTDSVEVSFLFAAAAGVYVSASAGNDGPTASTVAHPSPWITTTAAGTHNRDGQGTATIDGIVYNGATSAAGPVSGTLIEAQTAKLATAADTDAQLCFLGTLDPAKVAGKIVVCDRGVNARTDKSLAVRMAGGIGMIMLNTGANSINADLHYVPSIHLASTAYVAVHSAAAAAKSATISKGTLIYTADAPFTASFSSRGPLLAGGGDILKPDIMAPGQDVLAAVAPPGNHGREFDLYSGTSMSSPHMTALGALVHQAHPDWTPMMIKSAFMTTAYQGHDYDAFNWGAGHVDPNKAVDPGLVFDSGLNDWLAFLKGQKLYTGPGPSMDASDLNQASIAIGDLAGSQTVKRTATSVGSKSETYTFSTTGLDGVTATPSVASFTAAPGSATPWTVTFLRTTAFLKAYTKGFVVWTGDKGHIVKMPVVIRPVALQSPAEVSSNGSAVSWQVKAGYNGALNATVRGLVPATETAFDLAQDPNQSFSRTDPAGTFSRTVVVPPGSVFRAGIYEDAITPAGTDLDMFVYLGSSLVGQSADGDSNEEVTLRTGMNAATLTVYVHGYDTHGPSAHVTLFDWVVPNVGAGNTTLSGVGPVTIGAVQTHTASFSGLTAGKRYLGQVDYSDGASAIGATLLSVRP